MGNNADPDTSPVPDTAELWRRVHYQFLDTSTEPIQIRSSAFSFSSDGSGMSVNIGDDVRADGKVPADVLSVHQTECCLVALNAGEVRKLGLDIVRQEVPGELFHANVVGKATKSIRRKLAKLATFVVQPTDLQIRLANEFQQ